MGSIVVEDQRWEAMFVERRVRIGGHADRRATVAVLLRNMQMKAEEVRKLGMKGIK